MEKRCKRVTYNPISFITKPIKISKLSLALVELIKISFFKSYPRMCFINLSTSKITKMKPKLSDQIEHQLTFTQKSF